jgi:hypothetical protein
MKRLLRRKGASNTVKAFRALTRESEAYMSSTCTHTDELLTLGAMHLLSAEEEARLAERLRSCPACQARWKEYQALVGAMPRLAMAETAPSAAVQSNTTPSLNGNRPVRFSRMSANALQQEAPGSDTTSVSRPAAQRVKRHHASQRLVSIMSSLAAVVLLVGLVGGFWLLTFGRAHGISPTISNRARPTVTLKKYCSHIGEASYTGQATCALLVMDYSTTPATLVALDPTTGRPLPSLNPLPVGNASLAVLSADQRTLALGVNPSGDKAGNLPAIPYIQTVSLDTWRLGPAMDVGDHIQALAMTSDGTHIYAVSGTYSQNVASQAFLHYYTYDPGTHLWSHPWKSSLPILPDNQSSFSLSADGKTAYIFSAAVQTPELVSMSLGTKGAALAQSLPLQSIARGGEPPVGQSAAQPGLLPSIYNPAVIFAPERNRLYIIHAEANNPDQDVIAEINLATMQWIPPDINIGQPLADTSSQALLSTNTAGLYTGRDEQGTLSPDGRWFYLSGIRHQPQADPNGTEVEQHINMGLWKVNVQTGQIAGRWLPDNSYNALTVSQDGKVLYLFGPSDSSNPNLSGLLIFSTVQATPINWLGSIDAGPFILLLD